MDECKQYIAKYLTRSRVHSVFFGSIYCKYSGGWGNKKVLHGVPGKGRILTKIISADSTGHPAFSGKPVDLIAVSVIVL